MKIQKHLHTNPARTEITDEKGDWLARLTDGAYTVTLIGPSRTFSEVGVTPTVTHTVWVRTLPEPFDGELDEIWLADALAANDASVPDVLGLGMQYVKDAPREPADPAQMQIAGDARYGKKLKNGRRQEGADFNDYLGIPWTYPDGTFDKPELDQFRCLDCSGFIRMIWGYRRHLENHAYADTVPLCLAPLADCSALPRRAVQMAADGPGVILIPNIDSQVVNFSPLRPGDLLFFDADAKTDGTDIDHVAMFLGLDSNAEHRFLSSRQLPNGPTMSDPTLQGGGISKSVLDGSGPFASAFRSARRL